MPVVGGPTPYHQNLLTPRPNKVVRHAVQALSMQFPQPHSFNTALGYHLRQRRLAMELAEFDFLHRTRRGRPANYEQLCRVGDAIISQRKRSFPAGSPRLDEPLFVNAASFADFAEIAAADQKFNKKGDSI